MSKQQQNLLSLIGKVVVLMKETMKSAKLI